MKIYFYSCKKNINTYLLINESSKEAILIDPSDIPKYFIERIENEHILLKAVCITNQNIEEVKRGLKTWQNIYAFQTFEQSSLFNGTLDCLRTIQFSSFNMEVFSIKNRNETFCMYKFENALFTGQSLLASIFQFSFLNEIAIKDKMEDFDEQTMLFPFSGPPTTLKTLRKMCLNKILTKNPIVH